MLGDAQKQRAGQLASLAGFGAALQGYSHDLWGQTDQAYRQAGAAQQSLAQGLGGQVGSGVAGARAQEAALAGSLGYTGGIDLPTAEAATAQVASEGGANTGAMMGQVGTAWGGYGATRPEYIGFMTGQNQMQLEREGIQSDKDLRLEFAKLALDNPKTAQEMYLAAQQNKRENLSTSLAQQTLLQNFQMKKAQLQQQWYTARANAKDDAERRRIDRIYKAATVANDTAMAGIAQQNADASTTRATASVTRADTADWKAHHPTIAPPKYSSGDYGTKVASAMGALPTLFEHSGGTPAQKSDYAFGVLWGQMSRFVSPANQAKAKALLRQRILNAAKAYKPKPSSGKTGGFPGVTLGP